MLNVKQKPTTAPPAKTATRAVSNTASAQAAAAFSAHLKKSQAEQAQRAAKHNRREGMNRTPAANEPSLQQAELMTALDDVDERSGGGQQDQQCQDQQEQQNQQHQQQESWLQTEQRLVALDQMDELAAEMLAEHLAAVSEDAGLFDIVQPDGNTLSVAVTRSAARVSLLLSTTSAETSAQLQRCKMELEQRLGRRIGKDVVVAVL